jgi:hypothetical protein
MWLSLKTPQVLYYEVLALVQESSSFTVFDGSNPSPTTTSFLKGITPKTPRNLATSGVRHFRRVLG